MKSSAPSVFDPIADADRDTTGMRVDVDAVLRQKLPRHYSRIPRWIISALKRIVCQDQLNEILAAHGHLKGTDFASAMLHHLDVKVDISGLENIPQDDTRIIFASNHPLGALDGIAIIAAIGSRYPGKFRFIVNDMLMVVPPLAGIFLPVNKHGAQSRAAAEALAATMEGDFAIATFPAGLCSRNTHGKVIEDLEWQKTFVSKAKAYNRTIVPMHFEGQNSRFFYRLARWRRRFGIKFNIEMLFLPQEIFKSRGKRYKITIGKPIQATQLTLPLSDKQWAAEIRNRVYTLKNN